MKTDFLFNEKTVQAIIYLRRLGRINITELARSAGILSQSYLSDLIKKLENKGIVSTERQGRERLVKLTDKGRKLSKKIEEIEEI